jgi:hypothetical protein
VNLACAPASAVPRVPAPFGRCGADDALARRLRKLVAVVLCRLVRSASLDAARFSYWRLGEFVRAHLREISPLVFFVGLVVEKGYGGLLDVGALQVMAVLEEPGAKNGRVASACWTLAQFFRCGVDPEGLDGAAPALLEWVVEYAPKCEFAAKEHALLLACAIFRRMNAGGLDGEMVAAVLDLIEEAVAIEDAGMTVEAQYAVVALRAVMRARGEPTERVDALAESIREACDPADLAVLDADQC